MEESDSSSYVEIRHSPVTWSLSHQESGRVRVFYDDYHLEIMLVTRQKVLTSYFATACLVQHKIA